MTTTDPDLPPAPPDAPPALDALARGLLPAPGDDPRWELLRRPFDPDEIEKLPKQLNKGDQDKYQCREGTGGTRNGKAYGPSADGHYCGGYHARSLHLDYVGHAGVTMRLGEVDPAWTWEPMYRDVPPEVMVAALNSADPANVRMVIRNAPMRYSDGGLWIYLTVLGVTRPGFGDAAGKSGTNAVKEIIGDAIRNAALRFGVATYLWSKSERAAAQKIREEGADPDSVADGNPAPAERPAQRSRSRSPGDAGFEVTDGQGRPSSVEQARAAMAEGQPETAAARAIAQRRGRETARQQPTPQQAAEPAPKRPRDDGAALAFVDATLAESQDEKLRQLYVNAGHYPDGPNVDVAACLDAEAAALLDLDPSRPVPLVQVVVRAKRHLDSTGMSVRDHIRSDAEPVGTPTT